MKAAETTVLKLLQGSKVFLVPRFQRRYSWRRDEWEQLWDDLVRECRREHDPEPQTLEGHFLGSVVLHPAPGGASVLMKHLVVDGQQRLTTILVLIAAIRDAGREIDLPGWNPQEYDDKYLRNQWDEEYPDRLMPTVLDRVDYQRTVSDLVPTGGIGQAYTFFKKRLLEASSSADSELHLDLRQVANTLLLHMLIVEITTNPGDSVNNIFNRLNSKGMQLSAADLVRNELLLNLSESDSEDAYGRLWLPMEANLVKLRKDGARDDRSFVSFLWAREVMHAPDTTRLNLFLTFERRFRSRIKGLPHEARSARSLEIFEEIFFDHKLYLLLLDPYGSDMDAETVGWPLREALDKLRRWQSDPSTPFAFWVLKQSSIGEISEDEAVEAINILLGYLVRRTLAGIPTNQLNRLLTPLASQLQGRGTKTVVQRLREALELPGYHWPADAEVRGAVVRTPLYVSAKRQVPFLLEELERMHGHKEEVEFDNLTIEHVMPQSMPRHWADYLAEQGARVDDALAVLHTLGNLTLTAYNSELSNADFDVKREELAKSKLSLNHELSGTPFFSPAVIEARTQVLAERLLNELPAPTGRGNHSPLAGADLVEKLRTLETALQTLPEGEWTTDDDLMSYLGVDLGQVRGLVEKLGPEVARLVRTPSGEVPSWLMPDMQSAVSRQGFTAVPSLRATDVRLGILVTRVDDALERGDDSTFSARLGDLVSGQA